MIIQILAIRGMVRGLRLVIGHKRAILSKVISMILALNNKVNSVLHQIPNVHKQKNYFQRLVQNSYSDFCRVNR